MPLPSLILTYLRLKVEERVLLEEAQEHREGLQEHITSLRLLPPAKIPPALAIRVDSALATLRARD